MADGWTPSEDEMRISRNGVKLQAEGHGLDINDPNVAAFLEHQAEVIANLHAGMRFQQQVIHDMTFRKRQDNG
jgi:hypothetical protein